MKTEKKETNEKVLELPLSVRCKLLKMMCSGEDIRGVNVVTGDTISEKTIEDLLTGCLEIEGTKAAFGGVIMNPDGRILVHRECFKDWRYGKREESCSIQFTWRQEGESLMHGWERLIRAEVFDRLGKDRDLWELVTPLDSKPVAKLWVADALVDIGIFTITQKGLKEGFSSRKVEDVHWEGAGQLLTRDDLRSGVKEVLEFVVKDYFPYQQRAGEIIWSNLNQQVAAILGGKDAE